MVGATDLTSDAVQGHESRHACGGRSVVSLVSTSHHQTFCPYLNRRCQGLDVVLLHPDPGQSELSQRVSWVQANL